MGQKWGQNFLVHEGVCARIVAALEADPPERVLEVGPGRGALTRFLVGKVLELTVVELDQFLATGLQERWGKTAGFSLVNQDFLKWPLPAWPMGSIKVLGNLPYSAANPILNRLLGWNAWDRAVVMVQKEVAERIVARPGNRNYGLLSLAVQSRAEVKILFHVPPEFFRPQPKVTSTVLRLERRPTPLFSQEDVFFAVARAAFCQRRKTLLNSLCHGLSKNKTQIQTSLERLGIDPTRRAETLSLGEFEKLAGEFY